MDSPTAAFAAALPLRAPTVVRVSTPRRPSPRIVTPTAQTDPTHVPAPAKAQPTDPPRNHSRRAVLTAAAVSALGLVLPPRAPAVRAASVASAYDIAPAKDGHPFALSGYRGRTTLFVNVASYCALTPQYEGLVRLHETYATRGFDIIASPCNQFGRQEPDDDASICEFARRQFGAKFLLLDKLVVNDGVPGQPVAPLYRFLRDDSPERRGERIAWNFEKFLVGPDGHVLRRYKPGILPEAIEPDVQYALAHPGEGLPAKKKPYLGVE